MVAMKKTRHSWLANCVVKILAQLHWSFYLPINKCQWRFCLINWNSFGKILAQLHWSLITNIYHFVIFSVSCKFKSQYLKSLHKSTISTNCKLSDHISSLLLLSCDILVPLGFWEIFKTSKTIPNFNNFYTL